MDMLRWFTRRLSKPDSPPVATTDAPNPTLARVPANLEIPRDKIAARAAEIWERNAEAQPR